MAASKRAALLHSSASLLAWTASTSTPVSNPNDLYPSAQASI